MKMRTVFTFIKYNERLLADKAKLTERERKLIIRDTDPYAIHKFTPEEEEMLAKLKDRYGNFIIEYAEVEVEGTSNVEKIITEAFKKAGFVDYYNENPFLK